MPDHDFFESQTRQAQEMVQDLLDRGRAASERLIDVIENELRSQLTAVRTDMARLEQHLSDVSRRLGALGPTPGRPARSATMAAAERSGSGSGAPSADKATVPPKVAAEKGSTRAATTKSGAKKAAAKTSAAKNTGAKKSAAKTSAAKKSAAKKSAAKSTGAKKSGAKKSAAKKAVAKRSAAEKSVGSTTKKAAAAKAGSPVSHTAAAIGPTDSGAEPRPPDPTAPDKASG
jgi:hypothetical protein